MELAVLLTSFTAVEVTLALPASSPILANFNVCLVSLRVSRLSTPGKVVQNVGVAHTMSQSEPNNVERPVEMRTVRVRGK